ncbi:coiled-coil domain-containing protein 38 isoform X1 [Pantherophis guttatus]|uniref:Coiled-coil domain-containing protein 38 isoform X1 n=1 Tax=Pantherophis guttatus TaxID=94885 RepID=A0A6P9APZ0_PANGU|nr:coiled-coil domain-containing protein 38 isoform X1 [Pantherophis guttatus]
MASTSVTRSPFVELDEEYRQKTPFERNNTEIYLYRDIECTEKEIIRKTKQTLKAYERSTISSRARCRKALRKLEEVTEQETTETMGKDLPALNWALAFAKCWCLQILDVTLSSEVTLFSGVFFLTPHSFHTGCQSDKQSIADYISEEKELFLLEYSVKVKQRTMAKLEKMAAKEERRARIAEIKLDDDTLAFEDFLRQNDRSSVEALKLATQEAKYKMEVTTELRIAMNELFSLKSEIANTEDLLKLYLSYEAFLFSISPKAWQEQQMAKRKKDRKRSPSKSLISFPAPADKTKLISASIVLQNKANKMALHKGPQPAKKMIVEKSVSVNLGKPEEKAQVSSNEGDYRFFRKSSQGALDAKFIDDTYVSSESGLSENSFSLSSEDTFNLDDIQNCDKETEIYFKDTEELLQMFRYLEEQNLSLFQNIQDISGTLEESQQRKKIVKQHVEQKVKRLRDKKEALIAACLKEDGKSAELALKAKMFSSGEYNPASMNKILDALTKKVAEVYGVCCGTQEVSSMTSFQMLKKIEMRVSELCEMFEILPKEYLEIIEVTEKLRAKERRQRIREDKLKELRRIQEERLKLALERAVAEPKKRVGSRALERCVLGLCWMIAE